ncbi:MAG: bifunctional 4-hydroxy-2-oxoglutarate aldolase/2-dehydro-3-deoxy-phosphogluconate aldolase [Lentisphaerae bacterium]|nr:bifunctional 4-hydroxy-2-oxoglutarate aldolase/2-dehydro-3-deoxy-phosphogluconate aldolase [Lentisphaerota bacterium]
MKTAEDATGGILARLERIKVVPVLIVEKVDDGLRVAELISGAGLAAAEITFRTAAAADVIKAVRGAFPGLCLGAGTVLNAADLRRAFDAGAEFAVAPGLNPAVVREAAARGYPFFPGVLTPTDVENALGFGCRALKFFPAEAAGGIPMLKAIAAPYRHLGVRFIPTGGVTVKNFRDYLALPEVCAVGGTWLGKAADIAAGAWDAIARAMRETAALL